jgi:proteasome accessory factor A
MSAVDIQRYYLSAAQERLRGSSPDADWVLREWTCVLDDLENDLVLAADRVDWVAKRQMLEQYMQQEGLSWSDPTLQSLDLAYHDIDPQVGLHAGLEQAGQMRRLVTDEAIEAALTHPPADTRACIRGLFVSRFAPAVRSIGWNGVAFAHQGGDFAFDMGPLVEPGVQLLNEELAACRTLDDVVAVLRQETSAG